MKTKTRMGHVRLTGTVLVTPFVLAGAAFVVWGLIDRLAHWQALTQGRRLNEAELGVQMLMGVAAIALAVTRTASLWMRCFPRRRAWEDGAARLPNPFSTRGKYAVWNFHRPLERQSLFGTLRVRKKMRPSGLSR